MAKTLVAPARLEVEGALRVVAASVWPGSAITASPDGTWVAVALPGRVVVARLPDLSDIREIHVADVRSLAAIDPDRVALAPHRGLLIIEDPMGLPRVGVRARGVGRVRFVAGPDGVLAAVGERAALPRATVVTRVDAGRQRGWTPTVPGAIAAAWMGPHDLAVAAGADLVLVHDGVEHARVVAPLKGDHHRACRRFRWHGDRRRGPSGGAARHDPTGRTAADRDCAGWWSVGACGG